MACGEIRRSPVSSLPLKQISQIWAEFKEFQAVSKVSANLALSEHMLDGTSKAISASALANS